MNQALASSTLKSSVIDHLNSGVFAVDQSMEVVLWNNFMEINSGLRNNEVVGKNLFECFPQLPVNWLTRKIKNVFLLGNFSFTSWEERPYLFEFPHHRALKVDVEHMLQDSYFYPVKADNQAVEFVCISIHDVTDIGLSQGLLKTTIDKQQDLIAQLEEAKNQLQQSEKMAAIGQLSAGVAHEINNPIAFVTSNLASLKGYVDDLFSIVTSYESLESRLDKNDPDLQRIKQAKENADFVFLKEDLSGLLEESDDGLQRVRRIVEDLKDFSRPDSGEWEWSDIHHGIDSTLNVVSNEIKYKADVVKDYGTIPEINCIIAQLNQVFMNLIVNAAHAIEERGTITIRTGSRDGSIWIEVTDTGIGISEENQKQVFNPFFTTKPVGKGTGLGLSVSYGIVEKHKGKLEIESELGKGTTFRITLPVDSISLENDKLESEG